LEEGVETKLVSILKKNVKTFAWTIAETPSIDPDFLYHHLALDTG